MGQHHNLIVLTATIASLKLLMNSEHFLEASMPMRIRTGWSASFFESMVAADAVDHDHGGYVSDDRKHLLLVVMY